MPRLDLLLPGDPETRTGGYIYDGRILKGLRELGWETRVHRLDRSFPHPHRQALDHARHVLADLPSNALVMIDGLAMGAMPGVVAAESRRLRLVALVHHPLAEETGVPPQRKQALRDSEQLSLAVARLIVVTSRYTAGLVAALGVSAGRIAVVEPGTDPAPLARGSSGSALQLLCVATLTLRKGHAVLFDALAMLRNRDWRLVCVGAPDRDFEVVAGLRNQLERLHLNRRVILKGEVNQEALSMLYDGADLFVLASHFEGYGMALAEALAHGLPVVSARAGAIPETVPADAGLLVPPNDPESLADALAGLMDDPEPLLRLRKGACAARGHLPTWQDACLRMDQVLRAVPA